MTDEELMILVRDNDDHDAFNVLSVRWAAQLFRYFRRRWRLQPADAEDCTQDTLQNVWRGRKTYRDEYPFRVWIYGISYNVGYNFRNRPGRRGLIRGHARFLFQVPLGPEDELDRHHISDTLRAAFADKNRPLPDDARVEVVMKEWEWAITWWIKPNNSAEYEKKGYQVKRTQGLDIYSLGVVMGLSSGAEDFNTPAQSDSDILAEAELLIKLFHARSGRDKRVLRYRYWPPRQLADGARQVADEAQQAESWRVVIEILDWAWSIDNSKETAQQLYDSVLTYLNAVVREDAPHERAALVELYEKAQAVCQQNDFWTDPLDAVMTTISELQAAQVEAEQQAQKVAEPGRDSTDRQREQNRESSMCIEYDRLLGDPPPASFAPTPRFAEWIVGCFNSPSGTTTSHVHCLEETGVGNVTVGKVFLHFAMEYYLSTTFQEDNLRQLFSIYVSRYPKANEPRLIYRWYSRTECNGDPGRDAIDAVFVNQQPPANADLAYFIPRSQEVPSSFTDDVEAEPDEMPNLTESWNQYRAGVLKTLLATI